MLALALVAVLASAVTPAPTRSQSPTAVFSLCRTSVRPCQREVNLLPGQAVTLDLVLRYSDGNALPVAVWEAHLKLAGAGSVELVSPAGSAGPVRQQGDPRLALDALKGLTDGGSQVDAQYFTVQNRYSAASGELHYAVTLMGFGAAGPASRVETLQIRDGMVLGRITLRSTSSGVVDIVPGLVGNTFQAVSVSPSGELVPVEIAAVAVPLARINAGPGLAPVSLLGQVASPAWWPAFGAALPELSASFWEPAVLPPWRGGAALLVAVFDVIAPDSVGAFRVDDIPPVVLPPGAYNVRIKLPGALSQVVPDVVLPPVSGGSLTFGAPRYGDINGDDVVDAADLMLLRAGFGRLATDAGYQPMPISTPTRWWTVRTSPFWPSVCINGATSTRCLQLTALA